MQKKIYFTTLFTLSTVIISIFIFINNLSAATYDIVVAKDGSGNYNSVQQAVNAAKSGQTIYIKSGTYNEVVNIPSNKSNLKLLGENKDNVKITYNKCSSTAGGTIKSASVTVSAANFSAENITFDNSFDYDGSSLANKQALALSAQGDKQTYINCNFIGHQDTLYVSNGRQYFKGCLIQGVVDFIFGDATAVFDNCTIQCHYRSGGTGCITAPSTTSSRAYGLVFFNCTVKGDSNVKAGGFSLGRPWHPSSSSGVNSSTIYKNCNLSNVCGDWTDMSGVSWKNERFYEYKNTGAGAKTGSNRPQLNDSSAANCTVSNVLNGWNPN